MKKIIAVLLIFLQLLHPANAAGLFDVIGTTLQSQALKSASESLASGFGVSSVDPKGERAMDATAQRQADMVRTMFETGLSASAQGAPTHTDVYDPKNKELSKKQIERWKRFVAKTKDKKILSLDEMKESAASMLPFLRYYQGGTVDVRGNVVTVPPGQSAQVNLQGYCMDRGTAAPPSGEKMQLVPIRKLLPAEILPLYQAMMQFTAEHVEKRNEIQNLVWGLRHAADMNPPVRELGASQAALLDEAIQDGAATYRAYLVKQVQAGKDMRARKELFSQLLGQVNSKTGLRLPDPGLSGYTPSDSKALIDALTRMPVDGAPQANSEFTLLSLGVAAKTVANNLHDVRVEIKNTTAEPFIFDASQYVGQSTRVTQRVAFGGLFGNVSSDAKNATQRLSDVLKMLGISQLKNLQMQIQNTIDGLASQPGSSDMKLASLAVATAINQVLFPTSVLDLAFPNSKLASIAEKLTAREISGLEKVVTGGIDRADADRKHISADAVNEGY